MPIDITGCRYHTGEADPACYACRCVRGQDWSALHCEECEFSDNYVRANCEDCQGLVASWIQEYEASDAGAKGKAKVVDCRPSSPSNLVTQDKVVSRLG